MAQMKAATTQTNMETSEYDTKWVNSKKEKDSNQPYLLLSAYEMISIAIWDFDHFTQPYSNGWASQLVYNSPVSCPFTIQYKLYVFAVKQSNIMHVMCQTIKKRKDSR